MGYESETSAVVLPFNPIEVAKPLIVRVKAKAAMFRLCSRIVFLEADITTSMLVMRI